MDSSKDAKLRIAEQRAQNQVARFERSCGQIYLIKHEHGQVKIGFTFKDAQVRYLTLRAGTPYETELIFDRRVCDVMKYEKELHKRYSLKNAAREWFWLSDQDVEDIKSELEKKQLEYQASKTSFYDESLLNFKKALHLV